ncbi:MAG: ATP F0F1 synthase subunit B [Alphaproteobacteria bacterium]|nr:ATP F0F1 synthase subunit B [Alphaproteobacteria bacterium]
MIEELLKEPDFWEGLGLAIVIGLILYQKVPAMLAKMLDARAVAIQNELTQAKQLREEAEAVLVRTTQRASHAQAEAETILSQARAEAERFAKESEEQLKALVERRARQAADRIARAEAQAMAEIRALAADAAVAASAKIIAARIDDAKAGSLIDASIKDVGAKLN